MNRTVSAELICERRGCAYCVAATAYGRAALADRLPDDCQRCGAGLEASGGAA